MREEDFRLQKALEKANEAAFYRAVEDVARVSEELLAPLQTTARPKDREEEAAKAKARSALRFGA